VKLLLERGADPMVLDEDGWTPLFPAALEGYIDILDCLLEHPSGTTTLNHRSHRGETALWRACRNGRADSVGALLERGADPTIADNDGITPMAIAKQMPFTGDEEWARRRLECVPLLEVGVVFIVMMIIIIIMVIITVLSSCSHHIPLLLITCSCDQLAEA
jgi:ankyrin repeat protein